MRKLEFRVPESMLVSTPPDDKGEIVLVGFPNRKVHKRERPRILWFILCGRGRARLWTRGDILFHATREDMAEDALQLLRELLLANPQAGLGSDTILVGARNARLSDCLFLHSHLQVTEGPHSYYRGGRQLLRIYDWRKAFASLEKVREERNTRYEKQVYPLKRLGLEKTWHRKGEGPRWTLQYQLKNEKIHVHLSLRRNVVFHAPDAYTAGQVAFRELKKVVRRLKHQRLYCVNLHPTSEEGPNYHLNFWFLDRPGRTAKLLDMPGPEYVFVGHPRLETPKGVARNS